MGEIAAFITAISWSFTSIFFSNASVSIGSVRVNRLRLLVASIILFVLHFIITGSPIPISATREQWFWLGLSGIIGLALGDAFLFQAYVHIGPRLTTVIMALDPVFSAVIAWLWLNEKLTTMEITGILLTVIGVGWVVLERQNGNSDRSTKDLILGSLCALGAVLGQAVGFVLSKKGLEGNFSPLSAVLIRILIATLVMWMLRVRNPSATPPYTGKRPLFRGLFPYIGVSFFDISCLFRFGVQLVCNYCKSMGLSTKNIC